MIVSPLAGKPAPAAHLVNVAKLVAAYYSGVPDPTVEQNSINRIGRRKIQTILTQTPGNSPSIGGVKVVTESGWFAARPFGIENIYKIYVQSLRGQEHLRSIVEEAQAMVDEALA